MTAEEAAQLVEVEVQGIVSLINVLYTDQVPLRDGLFELHSSGDYGVTLQPVGVSKHVRVPAISMRSF